jgi:ribonucleotide reductase beta subunit family protein with ferritin-like domain
MSKQEWFIIEDLDKLVESTRILVYDNFNSSKDEKDELNIVMSDLSAEAIDEMNTVLTQQECLVIAKGLVKIQKHKTTNEVRYLLSDQKFMEMIECFNSRMVSNIISNLVKKNILDSAYDENLNDFVFWVKDDENKENQKPETD